MAVVQLSDVIVPEYFAESMANNSMVSTAHVGQIAGHEIPDPRRVPNRRFVRFFVDQERFAALIAGAEELTLASGRESRTSD